MRTITSRWMLSGATALALVSLAACAPEPEPEPELLTVSAAGGRYLDAVCPVNTAWDAVDIEVDRLRIAVARGGEVDTRLFADAIHTLELESTRAAQQLGDDTIEWPAGVARAIGDVRATLKSDAEQAAEVAKLSPDEVVKYSWIGADQLSAAAHEARTGLGLGDDPVAVCADVETAGTIGIEGAAEESSDVKPQPGAETSD